ncbi:putative Heterokaryon incompatibility domain-containing protein [Seiridium cardinale]|uniref:Heterokaryon incompatibility domain-containing protein n=1 Tax=Seiridium cardinale TaxID=138064 RepID=A0ABR2Y212_9PEZI
MSLCQLCLKIPFDSLPRPHPSTRFSRTFDQTELPALSCSRECAETCGFEKLGHLWHPNLEALGESANTCALCATVQGGIQAWLRHFDRGSKSDFFVKHREIYDDVVPAGQKLHLAQRYGGSPGFVVLVRDAKYKRIFVLTGLSFSVDAENPATSIIQQRPPDPDSSSEHNLDVAASLLNRCRDQHRDCVLHEPLLPSRILDISLPDDIVKLVEPREQTGRYACLSYCWGGGVNFITSRATIDERRSGVHVSDLPKTFRDAINLARHLGIPYLWIDSLCICQDDGEDWARESARMIDIYSNAFLVIAANHAASAADGCFNIRPDRPSCKVDLPGYAQNVHVQTVYVSDEVDWYGGSFPYESLSTRCWALQERILARRLLHYNSRQLYYECDSGIFGEDGSWQDSRYGESGTLRLPPSETPIDQSGIHELWYYLVGQYGSRKLTRITDRLPAMSGLAKRFATRIDAQYLAGIWGDELIEGIAWQSLGSRKPAARDQYIAPSWSWASYGGTAAMGIHSPYTSVADVLGWDIQLKHEAYPFGELIGGWLRIRAPVVSLFTAGDDAWNTGEWSRRIPVTTAYSKPDDSINIHPDDTEDYDITYWKHLKTKAILLFQYEPYEERGPDDCLGYGLVVIDADDTGSNRMRRVGWMHLDAEEAQKMRDDQANWSIIELV